MIESDEAKQRMYDTFANKHQFNQHHIKEASHTILLAHKTHYNRDDFAKVVDKGIIDGRTQAENRDKAFGSFVFAERIQMKTATPARGQNHKSTLH